MRRIISRRRRMDGLKIKKRVSEYFRKKFDLFCNEIELKRLTVT
jgi:hypothetical protein